MDPLTTAAAGGMRALMESLDMLANNIANASTAGFKVDREFYGTYADAEVEEGLNQPSLLPVLEKPWTDFTQGTMQPTGKPLDFALAGEGFFAVQGPTGPLYTRAGSFQSKGDGSIISGEGYPVRTVGGTPLKLAPGQSFEVGVDGTVRQGGVAAGKLEVVEVPKEGLVKHGATLFRMTNPSVKPKPATDVEVHQGKLESSNVSSPEASVRLINIMRQFETLQKAVGIGVEMNKHSIEEVARVSS